MEENILLFMVDDIKIMIIFVFILVIIGRERTEITRWAVLTQLGRKHNVIWYGVKDKPHWSHTGK